MDRVTRNVLKVRLLVPCRPVLLEPFEVLSGVMRCDKMWNKLWVRTSTVSLNSIFFCSVDFTLVGLASFTWGVDFSDIYLSFLYLVLVTATFAMYR